MKTFAFTIFQILLLLNIIHAQAQIPGSLDQTFGSSGKVATHLNVTATLRDMVIQPDGKIVVVGVTFGPPPTPMQPFGPLTAVIARFNPNGTLDTTFDGDGFNHSYFMSDANAVVLQPDGKIVVGGSGLSGNVGGFSVARFNADGSLDTTFNGTGKTVTTVGIDSTAFSINLQADGKIVAAGMTALVLPYSARDFALVRYNADGSLDTNFGTGGRVATDIGSSTDVAYHSAVQADGKILVAGYSTNPLPNLKSATIVRYNPDGTLDMGFGMGGKVIRPGPGDSNVREMALQADGKIIIVGEGNPPLRYNPNGTFDIAFEASGNYVPQSLAIQANGKIVVGGFDAVGGHNGFAVVRYNPTGALDTTFGMGGKALTAFVSDTHVEAVAIQADGKIVAGGTVLNNNFEMVLARYLGGAASRPTLMDFDGDGKADVSVFRPSDATWYLNQSSNGLTGIRFGLATDRLAPADMDGDGRTDIALFREGVWYWLNSSNNSFQAMQFGQAGDMPVPGDYTGDGRAELAVYRSGAWYTLDLANNQFQGVQFGIATDMPVPADYDGDAKFDYAVYRDGTWYLLNSTNGFNAVQFGNASDRPVACDYDGDARADQAVYREGVWYVLKSTQGFYAVQFGVAQDVPVPADYDGDGLAEPAVFRDGSWYQLRSQEGFGTMQFGLAGDRPVPAAFIP